MTAFSDYLENALLDAILRGVTFTSPSSTYLSLHTSAGATESTADWAATELTGAAVNYARKQALTSEWTAASGGASSTNASLAFAAAGSNWGTITHLGIWDASSGGNLLFYVALPASRIINNGDVATITSGNLTVTLQ